MLFLYSHFTHANSKIEEEEGTNIVPSSIGGKRVLFFWVRIHFWFVLFCDWQLWSGQQTNIIAYVRVLVFFFFFFFFVGSIGVLKMRTKLGKFWWFASWPTSKQNGWWETTYIIAKSVLQKRSHQKGKENKGEGIQHSRCNNYAHAPKQCAHQLIGEEKSPKEHPSESGTYI